MLNIESGDVKSRECGLLVIPVAEEKLLHGDESVRDLVDAARAYPEFRGRKSDEILLYRPEGSRAERVLFLGVGKSREADAEAFRKAAGKAVKKAIALELQDLVLSLPEAGRMALELPVAAAALLEGACLGNHVFDLYKKEKKQTQLQAITLLTDTEAVGALEGLARRVENICKASLMARDWVSMPPNEKRPDRFVRSITKAADKEALSVTVLDEPALKKNKMGGILSVGAGSRSRARMVILEYSPKKAKKTYALVGKGVTFDSGGINLKSSTGLDDMKMDMAGAASVAAAMIAVSRLKPDYRVVGLIPVVENMPSGDSARPGDIITAYAGKTVEIGNTDAEGRLILIDALAYAERMFAPDVMVDIATLTGACIMALGEKIAGVFSRDRELSDTIVSAGERVHERCWAMPLPEDYRELLKSDFADIRNIGSSRYGGAIAAGLFLSEFVQSSRWAHIDIAGPAYAKKGSDYCGAGGTGFGVRLLIEALENL